MTKLPPKSQSGFRAESGKYQCSSYRVLHHDALRSMLPQSELEYHNLEDVESVISFPPKGQYAPFSNRYWYTGKSQLSIFSYAVDSLPASLRYYELAHLYDGPPEFGPCLTSVANPWELKEWQRYATELWDYSRELSHFMDHATNSEFEQFQNGHSARILRAKQSGQLKLRIVK